MSNWKLIAIQNIHFVSCFNCIYKQWRRIYETKAQSSWFDAAFQLEPREFCVSWFSVSTELVSITWKFSCFKRVMIDGWAHKSFAWLRQTESWKTFPATLNLTLSSAMIQLLAAIFPRVVCELSIHSMLGFWTSNRSPRNTFKRFFCTIATRACWTADDERRKENSKQNKKRKQRKVFLFPIDEDFYFIYCWTVVDGDRKFIARK